MSNLLLPEHIYKDVPGFEGLYYARTDGKIFFYSKYWSGKNGCLVNKIGGELKPKLSKNGYLRICLSKNNLKLWTTAHRIVAITFVSNPFNKPQVNHKDGIKTNNWYWNLEWSTGKENIAHAVRNGKRKKYTRSKLNEKQVQAIRKYKEISGNILSELLDMSPSTISDIRHNKTWINADPKT